MTDFQFFLPGQTFELLEDVVIPDIHASGMYWFRQLEGIAYGTHGPAHSYTLPAGTVIKLVNFKANSSGSMVSLWILWSPDRRLMPKSRGGTGRRVNFWPKLDELNALGMKVKLVV